MPNGKFNKVDAASPPRHHDLWITCHKVTNLQSWFVLISHL